MIIKVGGLEPLGPIGVYAYGDIPAFTVCPYQMLVLDVVTPEGCKAEST